MPKTASTPAERAATLLRMALKGGRKLLFVVGNGVSLVEFYDLASAHKELKKSGSDAQKVNARDWRWYMHERARLLTSSRRPSPAHGLIVSAIMAGRADAVITSNYDCYLDNAFEKSGLSGRWRQNPVLTAGQWEMEGYRSRRQGVGKFVRLWKVHGDVRYAVFVPCNHVFALPRFMVPYPAVGDIRQYIGDHCTRDGEAVMCLHAHCGYGVSPRDNPLLIQIHETVDMFHFIDYEFPDREIFKPDIAGAMEEIESPRVGAIIVMGFRGEQSAAKREWEELATPLLKRCRSGTPVIMLIRDGLPPGPGRSILHDGIYAENHDYVVYDDCTRSLKAILEWLGVDTGSVYADWCRHPEWFAEEDA